MSAGHLDPSTVELSAEQWKRIDSVCERFERQWKAGPAPALADHLAGVGGAERRALLRELLRLEVHYRARQGERLGAGEYLKRWPDDPEAVWSAFPTEEGQEHTTDEEREETPAKPAADPAWPKIPGYEVVDVLGRGGMGVVYRARQLRVGGREVALKVLKSAPDEDSSLSRRFAGEVEALARLDHPHIVRVHDGGEHAGCPYLVMERVAGRSLADRLAEGVPAPAESARLVMLLARAVQSAHEAGVIHRDLKPGNVLLAPPADEPALNTAWGCPKVADFGLAKFADQSLTAAGVITGTPAYMAPEQAYSRPDSIGPATDVYGLGAILYRLLAGRVPFRGENAVATMSLVKTEPPTPPRALRPEVPAELEAICLKCLEKDPADRYGSAAELAEDLRRFLSDEGVQAKQAAKRPRRRGVRGWAIEFGLALGKFRVTFAVTCGVLLLGLVGLGFLGNQAGDTFSHVGDPIHGGARPAPPPDRTKRLEAELTVRVWSRDGIRNKRGRVIGENLWALPVYEDEQLQIGAEVNQPAYLYLLWVDGAGTVTPLYPWNEDEIVHGSVAVPPPEREPRDLLLYPTKTAGYPLDGTVGLETILLLVRRTPLPREVSLADVLGLVPRAELGPEDEVVVREFRPGEPGGTFLMNRSRAPKAKAEAIDDQLLQLAGRLQPHFELIKAVQFAHAAKKGGE